ncbi:MAG TPA: alginate lyase family protein, partial [Acidimicrobiales bacterium]|nr:alginate lyase family protein [Acidimicrobiales bacterium]
MGPERLSTATRRLALHQAGRIDHASERLWEISLRTSTLPSRGQMTALLRRNALPSFTEYVTGQRRGAGQRNFLPVQRDRWVKEVEDRWPQAVSGIISTGESLVTGRPSLFGRRAVPMARRRDLTTGVALLDWRRDPLSQARFSGTFSEYRWDPARMRPPGADVKGPWELTRAQHLVTLGQAYWLTGDERFADGYALTIADFIRRNPVRLGVHWACNMDVSLRVVGWLAALPFFQGSRSLTHRWWELFCRALVAHGRYMLAHLEFGTLDGRIVTSNHYLANVFGLHWLALNFPGLDAGAVWRGCAERALELECQRQIAADGGPFESSIAYLRFVVEMLLSSWALSQHAGCPLSTEYRERLTKGLEFLRAMRQEGGRLPQVGDVDNGRAHIFTRYADWDTESADWLLVAGANVLGRPDLAEGAHEMDQMEALFWGTPCNRQQEPPVPQAGPVRAFPASGIAVVRDRDSQVTIFNTAVGTEGFGNHKHNDQLSLEWCVRDQPLLVDPGSYTYTQDPAARNEFRRTAAHTTVTVDGEEQHELRPELLFRMFERGQGSLEVTKSGVLASHSAYERLGVLHSRRLSAIGQGCFVVDDFFYGSEGHVLEWSFGLHPDISIDIEE